MATGQVEGLQVGCDPSASKAVRTVWRQAQLAFKHKDYGLAVESIEQLIAVHGADAGPVPASELYAVLGVTLLRLRRTDEGVEQLLKAVALDPSSAWAHYKLGLGYGRQRRQEEALMQFLRALHFDPNNAEFLCRLGLQYRRLGRNAEARAAYEAAVEHDPAQEEAIVALGQLSQALPPQDTD